MTNDPKHDLIDLNETPGRRLGERITAVLVGACVVATIAGSFWVLHLIGL